MESNIKTYQDSPTAGNRLGPALAVHLVRLTPRIGPCQCRPIDSIVGGCWGQFLDFWYILILASACFSYIRIQNPHQASCMQFNSNRQCCAAVPYFYNYIIEINYSYIVLSIRSIWGYVNITTGFFKNSHPPTCCHITPDPSAPPWSMLLPNACPHPNRNGCFFEGLSKQSDVTTLTSGKGGMQVSSQWVWQDGCFFWRTRYVSLAFACSAARIVRRDLLHQAAK